MHRAIISMFTFLLFGVCSGQTRNIIYQAVTSDTLNADHFLIFRKQSKVELISMPKHHANQFKTVLKYSRSKDGITLVPQNAKSDSLHLINLRLGQFINSLKIQPDGRSLLDTVNNVIYVQRRDFEDGFNIIYIIDGKKLVQESSFANYLGVMNQASKANPEIDYELDRIEHNIDRYTVTFYKGLQAYRQFGYENVFGVFEIQLK